jgi:hypothetical protein
VKPGHHMAEALLEMAPGERWWELARLYVAPGSYETQWAITTAPFFSLGEQ